MNMIFLVNFICMQEVKINYGMKEKNPLKQHYFYSKHEPDIAITEDEVLSWG